MSYRKRNIAIDMLRATIMFVMIFVNDFWKIHDVPHWLEHAKYCEDFMGFSDIVFPAFLFVVGLSIPYAIENRYSKGNSAESILWHILSRTFALLIMGAFITNSEYRLSSSSPYPIGVYWFIMVFGFICIWNKYPKAPTPLRKKIIIGKKVIGWICLLYLAFTFRNPEEGVFGAHWGILGTIGWTYLVCSLIYIFTRDRLKYLLPIWFLFVLICILETPLRASLGGVPILNFPDGNFLNSMLNILHIGNGGLPALTLGGIIVAVFGVRYGDRSLRWKNIVYGFTVLGLFLLGRVLHYFFIVSKLQSTPVWVLYVLAITITLYAILTILVRKNITSWFKLIRPAGTATLTTYLIPYVFYGFADVTGVILPDWFTHGILGLVNCLCFAFVVIMVCGILEKLNIKLKI